MGDTDTGQWRRAAELFDDLIDLSPAARAERLEAACANDPELRVAVDRLFAAHERAVGETGAGERLVAGALRAWAEDGDLPEGTPIGPFRCVRALGSGGMGQVYLAERDIDGRTQQVALKLPRVRMGSEFLTRFRRERAILAQLQHRAIARLIDAGELADQRPYLAMEYVLGQPIDVYCRVASLNIPARLRLVRKVLDAVQHAHERLVLHRDIKPANILVDAGGDPRVLDFGIGKQLEDESPQLTADGQRYFSLASAAPEQIRGEPSSAATDVYAVGVLLYELLSGVPPLAFDGLDPHAALQRALEQVPPLASVAVGQLSAADRTRMAAERGLRDSAWVGALRGDLDQILARALRKEPGQRYATAAAFAADLDAVLELRPISARQSERWYRLNRFIRRHLVAVASISALLLAISVFVTLTIWQSAQVRTARDQSEQVTEFLKNLFRQVDPTVARGRELTAQDLLTQGIDKLRASMQDQPAVKAELLTVMADIEMSLGKSDIAFELAEEALALRRAHNQALAGSHAQMARIELSRSRYAEALGYIEMEIEAELNPAEASDLQLHMIILREAALSAQGRAPAESLARWQLLADETSRRYGSDDPRARDARSRLINQSRAAGEMAAQDALIQKELARADLSEGGNDPARISALNQAASLARRDGDVARAVALASEALRVARVVYGEDHRSYAVATIALANIHNEAGHWDEAARGYLAALAIVRVPEDEPGIYLGAQYNLASLQLDELKQPEAALPRLEEAIRIQESIAPGSINLVSFRMAQGHALVDLGRWQEADQVFALAQARLSTDAGRYPNMLRAVGALRLCASTDSRPADWKQQLSEALKRLSSDDPGNTSLKRLRRCLERENHAA